MRGPLWTPFGCPLPVLSPEGAAVHASPLPLVYVSAHGPGEGETQAGRGLHLVGAAEVHSEDILRVMKEHIINPNRQTEYPSMTPPPGGGLQYRNQPPLPLGKQYFHGFLNILKHLKSDCSWIEIKCQSRTEAPRGPRGLISADDVTGY